MEQTGFSPADILLPKEGTDLKKWSVVACDQYTSEPEYWERVERTVGDAPSAGKIILPEAYLGSPQEAGRIQSINRTMRNYLDGGLFETLPDSYIYLERRLASGKIRRGLIGKLDLEHYDYSRGTKSLIRPTEGTVESRLPPRIKVRENAPLELPHIMVLIDDPSRTVIEPLAGETSRMRKVYDFDLMESGGHSTGWALDGESAAMAEAALAGLLAAARETTDYEHPLLFAMGDGNHSLATAKACFERLKQTLPRKRWENHPARWALVELVNVHDGGLDFEPIHRVLFGVNPGHVMAAMGQYYSLTGNGGGQAFDYLTANDAGRITVANPLSNLAVGTLQKFLDDYLSKNGGDIDYIHGEDTVRRLCRQEGAMGFLLPVMEKADLFRTVLLDGALPRKTFSMGEAHEKRFYLEARRIQ